MTSPHHGGKYNPPKVTQGFQVNLLETRATNGKMRRANSISSLVYSKRAFEKTSLILVQPQRIAIQTVRHPTEYRIHAVPEKTEKTKKTTSMIKLEL